MINIDSKTRQRILCLVLLVMTSVGTSLPAQSERERASHNPSAATLKVLYKFPFDGGGPSGYSHGKVLYSELIQGGDGNFYGTTVNGGSGTCSDGFGVEGCGTIFRITPAGKQTVVYSFTYDSKTNTAVNGLYPVGGLVQGKDGNLYGTASGGGDPKGFCNGYALGCGTIFKITPKGKFTLLHQFEGNTEGAIPLGRLIQASDGKLYGTTNQGGLVQGFYNQGTIFSITSSGAFSTVHLFDGVHVLDGRNPYAGLTQGRDGAFYGTTTLGGTDGAGTVFRFSKSGGVTVLHSFVHNVNPPSYPEGALPTAPLIQASDGRFYGAATTGGTKANVNNGGTLFRITPKGVFTKLWDFNPNGNYDGWYPQGGLIQATDGNLYGTTANAGTGDCLSGYLCGSVYQLTSAGAVTQMAAFQDAKDGRSPLSSPLQGTDGTLYITNSSGPYVGSHDGGGTIVQIDNALPKPKPVIVKFSPTSGPVGQGVTISGEHFVGTKKVAFNGTAAAFTVKSTSVLTAIVPSGASTGPITVTNAGGSATSKGIFTVKRTHVLRLNSR
jgi:uncharacterized repeat protein (TIGR03803 family)